MAANDPWTGTTWTVYGGGPDIKPPSKTGQFSLVAVNDPVKGGVAYYRVTVTGGGMPAPWSNCLLYPRGSQPAPPLATKLPPWSSGSDAQWKSATATVLSGVTATTSRLEGDLTASKAVTLVQVANATTAGAPLVAVQVKTSGGGAQPNDDGTGYGSGGGGMRPADDGTGLGSGGGS